MSVALMVVDARFDVLKPVRSQMGLVLMESYWITDLPQRAWQGVAGQFGSRTELIAENEKLKTEALLLQGRLSALVASYGSEFALSGPGWRGSLALLAGSALMGWLGAWLATGHHLRRTRPTDV